MRTFREYYGRRCIQEATGDEMEAAINQAIEIVKRSNPQKAQALIPALNADNEELYKGIVGFIGDQNPVEVDALAKYLSMVSVPGTQSTGQQFGGNLGQQAANNYGRTQSPVKTPKISQADFQANKNNPNFGKGEMEAEGFRWKPVQSIRGGGVWIAPPGYWS